MIMRRSAKRALQTAVVLAIAILGAVCAMQMNQNPLAEVCVLVLVALSVIGVCLDEITTPASNLEGALADGIGSLQKVDPAEQQFTSALAVIVRLVQAHLKANSQYSDSLESANRDLSFTLGPDQVRSVIAV